MPDTQLYPTFDIPSAGTVADSNEGMEFKPSPKFDYERGDFVRDGANRVIMVDGRDAFKIWVQKVLKTQITACLCYLSTGIDMEGALAAPTHEAVQSALERTITEALLANPCTERVYGFEFSWEADTIHVHFTVQPRAWAAFDIDQNIV